MGCDYIKLYGHTADGRNPAPVDRCSTIGAGFRNHLNQTAGNYGKQVHRPILHHHLLERLKDRATCQNGPPAMMFGCNAGDSTKPARQLVFLFQRSKRSTIGDL